MNRIPDKIEIALMDNNADSFIKWAQIGNRKNATRADGTSLLEVIIDRTINNSLLKSFLNLEPDMMKENKEGKNGVDIILSHYSRDIFNPNFAGEAEALVPQIIDLYVRQRKNYGKALEKLKISFESALKEFKAHSELLQARLKDEKSHPGTGELLKYNNKKVKALEGFIDWIDKTAEELKELNKKHEPKLKLNQLPKNVIEALTINAQKTISEYIKHEKNLENSDENGKTLLILAASSNNLEMVKLLLEKGASPDANDNLKMTPLHYAAMNGYVNIVQEILGWMARQDKIFVLDSKGNSPLDYAKQKGHQEIINILQKRIN